MVKCLPLKDEKIRYPTKIEMKKCFRNFEIELKEMSPKKLVLYGKQVSDYVIKVFAPESEPHIFDGGFTHYATDKYEILTAPHPSYMLIYRRKFLDRYIKTIREFMASSSGL